MAGDGRLMGSRQSHHALDTLHVSLILFALFLLTLTGLALGSLSRCARFQLASDELEVVGDLDTALQEEELQVSGLVLQLNLVAVFQGFTDGTTRAKHGQDLTPVWALNPVQAGHQCVLLFGRPGAALARQPGLAARRGGLRRGGLAGSLIENLGRL